MIKVETKHFISGRGTRKKARALVRLYEKSKSPVSGVVVNGRDVDLYFADLKGDAAKILRPFQVVDLLGKFNASVKVFGGGKKAQVEAIALAIAKALVSWKSDLRLILRQEGFLSRDPRMVESKKYGRHKARRGHQFSKR